jgi:hypothetical protein
VLTELMTGDEKSRVTGRIREVEGPTEGRGVLPEWLAQSLPEELEGVLTEQGESEHWYAEECESRMPSAQPYLPKTAVAECHVCSE